MIPIDFIEKKKVGKEHTPEEIQEFIMAYVAGKIPDYQMAAWLMAVNFKGMTVDETIALVDTMIHSGETVDLSGISRFKVDKHSTGGVGDKISLILGPLAAAVGCVVPMISGRSLCHSGGTLDKLESIPGFRVNLSRREFVQQVEKSGLAIASQTKELVPADRKMYALRDVTSTVKSIPLICGSILSKKVAAGIDGLVLDVKTGNGAFLSEYNESQKLARWLKKVGEHFGLRVKVVLTDMNQPLGRAVGNWLEVAETIEVLKGEGPEDVIELTIYLTAWMMILSGIERDFDKAKKVAFDTLSSGRAYEKFIEMVSNQEGDVSSIEDPGRYHKAECIEPVMSEESGFVDNIDTRAIGMAALSLGAGRKTLTDVIKPEVGIEIHKRIGDSVEPGELLGVVHATDEDSLEKAHRTLLRAFRIKPDQQTSPPLIYETF